MTENQRGKAAYFSLREMGRNSTRNDVKLYEERVETLRRSGRFSYTLLKPNVSAEYCFNKC